MKKRLAARDARIAVLEESACTFEHFFGVYDAEPWCVAYVVGSSSCRQQSGVTFYSILFWYGLYAVFVLSVNGIY